MLVEVKPALSQIRWHIQAALADFETLNHDPETMIAAAKGELDMLLEYLNALESANQLVAVIRDSDGNTRLGIKGFVGECDVFD